MSRSQKYTISRVTPEYYSDFLINFDRNPVTNTLAKATNEDSIKASIRNIILTRLGERFYAPLTGSKVANILFELNTDNTSSLLYNSIEFAIKNCEPRVKFINAEIERYDDQNAISIAVFFETINNPGVTHSVVIFKRIR